MKRKTTRATKRAKRKADKLAGMNKPSGKSRYGLKDRPREIARGYSKRPTSPFYLPPTSVREQGGEPEEDENDAAA